MLISLYKNRNSKWRQRTIRKEHDSDDLFIDIPLGLAYMPTEDKVPNLQAWN